MQDNSNKHGALFQGKQIRKILFENQWWFSVVDVVAVLSECEDPNDYWHKMKLREKEETAAQLSIICRRRLKIEASDGKKYATDCATIEGMFRVIQSIPSPKAEPFKRWLARVGKERLDEIENPELGIERARSLYEKKGYPKDWIEKREIPRACPPYKKMRTTAAPLPVERAEILKSRLAVRLFPKRII